jgi:cyclophilin family peptidyl-prolyl cis-trans isomerase/HEAT repeat protein
MSGRRILCGAVLSTAICGIALAVGTGLDERRAYLLKVTDQWHIPTPMAVTMLQDPYVEIRAQVARVLAVNPDPTKTLLLRRYATDASLRVRERAMLAAGRAGEPAMAIALTGLKDSAPVVRQGAAWAASHGGTSALEPIAALLLTERSSEVTTTALANLWRFGDAAWEGHAGRFASHTDPNLRRAAAYSLARSSKPARTRSLTVLCRDVEPVIRATAIGGLRQGPLSVDQRALLASALSDQDWRVQSAACQVLASRPEIELDAAAAQRLGSLWFDDHAQLAVPALEAAAAHPGAGEDDDLAHCVTHCEPWSAGTALRALARRDPNRAAVIATQWLGSEEAWRRRAGARCAVNLPVEAQQALQRRILADPEASVRLAWLESLDGETANPRTESLWGLVDGDPDPAVRAQALGLLDEVAGPLEAERLLSLYRRWGSDAAPDARAAALAAALPRAGTEPRRRDEILEIAAGDPNSAVAALIHTEAGGTAVVGDIPGRDARHGEKWYRDLVAWSIEEHWLDLVTVRGTFRIRLDAREVPITSREVWDLALAGFYDGLTVHRVVPNFVIQGGDPRGDGWGGPGFTLPDEPSLRPFDSWRVGIATSGPNTGGCQFFVTLMPADRLTGHYTNFGEVVAGREVLTRLQVGDRIIRVETASGEQPPRPTPVLVGALEWQDLAGLEGWETERTGFRPDEAALDRLRATTGNYTVWTVLGSWCSDSRREVPRLQRVLEQVAGDHLRHHLVGVDRTKWIGERGELADLIGALAVELVPTVVVVNEQGQELGRIVERSEVPIEQLLVEFLASSEGWS